MKSCRQIPDVAVAKGAVSLNTVAAAHGFARPVSLANLAQALDVAKFNAVVTTPSPEALGGTVDLTIRADGSFTLVVHMHDSGFPDYSFRLGILLQATDGKIFALYSSGTVHGTLGSGSRDFDETQSGPPDGNSSLATNWAAFFFGTLSVHREYQDNLTSWLTDAGLDILKFVSTVVVLGGPAALVIWGGRALSSLTGVTLPANLGWPGLLLAEGAYVVAGPGYFIPLFVVGVAATALAVKQRPLRPAEIAAAQAVFLDTIDYGAVTVWNVADSHGRCFTVPGPGGGAFIAAEPYFDDLLASDSARHTLIHELTHVWQIQHDSSKVIFSCDSISRSADQLTLGTDRLYLKYYHYDFPPTKAWDDYGPEQQAQIVADWAVPSQAELLSSVDTNASAATDPIVAAVVANFEAAIRTANAPYVDGNIRTITP